MVILQNTHGVSQWPKCSADCIANLLPYRQLDPPHSYCPLPSMDDGPAIPRQSRTSLVATRRTSKHWSWIPGTCWGFDLADNESNTALSDPETLRLSSDSGQTGQSHAASVIRSETNIQEVFQHLSRRGCRDLTDELENLGAPELSGQLPVIYANGSFGDVWLWRTKNGRQVAIKCLRLTATGDEDKRHLTRATREIYYWYKAKHINILELEGIALFQGQLGMISPWMENGSLKDYIRKHPQVNRQQLCLQVAEGLNYLHEVKMVHGDLKAANILVDEQGTIKLTDFGNARVEDCSLTFSTESNIGGGSVRWMAPELLAETNPPTKQSTFTDIYALGMACLEIISGQAPYHEHLHYPSVINAVQKKHRPSRPEQLSERTELGNEWWEILLDCWNRNPARRPDSRTARDRMKVLIEAISLTSI